MNIVYKIADAAEEISQIHALNYQAFVVEVKQHSPNAEKQLIDKFHNENIYLIAKKSDKVIGMLAVRDRRPFSLDLKLDKAVDDCLPSSVNNLCEVRLLTILKEYRHSCVILKLFQKLAEYASRKGYDSAVISGVLNQVKLYQHLGFIPFSKIIGKNNTYFQPMYIFINDFKKNISAKSLKYQSL